MRFCPNDGSLLDVVARRSGDDLVDTEFKCGICKYRYALKTPLIEVTKMEPKKAEGALCFEEGEFVWRSSLEWDGRGFEEGK